MSRYEALLNELRTAFPAAASGTAAAASELSAPIASDTLADWLSRALARAATLKTASPLLGTPLEPDYAAARESRLGAASRPMQEIVDELVAALRGMLAFDHPLVQMNVEPLPTIASLVGMLLAAIYNPNLCSDESSRGVSRAEVAATALAAELVGYDSQKAGGVFTFGGTGALAYGVKLGLEKAVPGSGAHGVSGRPVVIASEASHYACRTVASWLGIGHENLLTVAAGDDRAVDVAALEASARGVLVKGRPLAAIIATVGTTDAFGVDDLPAIVAMRDRLVEEFALAYRPHIHADAVIGWAWSVLADYDWQANRLELPPQVGEQVRPLATRLAGLRLADSLGIDFHKTGFAPYVSSLVLLRERGDLARLARRQELAPYLFHTGENHPGLYTLETTRAAGGALAALASLRLLGRDGLRVLLAHGVEMATVLAAELASRPGWAVLNRGSGGAATLFRAFPEGADAAACLRRECDDAGAGKVTTRHNELNRRIFQHMRTRALAGAGAAIGFTSCWRNGASGEAVAALRSFVLSPAARAEDMQELARQVEAARRAVLLEM